MSDNVVYNYPTEMTRTTFGYIPKDLFSLGSVGCAPRMYGDISLESLYNDTPKIEKTLTRSDTGNNHSLMLPAGDVERAFFSQMNAGWIELCNSGDGVRFHVVDLDDEDNSASLNLVLKKHASFVLMENWKQNFVVRKGLKPGDVVGIVLAYGFLIMKFDQRD